MSDGVVYRLPMENRSDGTIMDAGTQTVEDRSTQTCSADYGEAMGDREGKMAVQPLTKAPLTAMTNERVEGKETSAGEESSR